MSSSAVSSKSTASSSAPAFTAIIPSAEGNPFISSTSLPEGTLFITVGSILLGIIVTILLWRAYAIWASHRAATYNEARFTALEPSYGGPFVDPVTERTAESDDEGIEKVPEMHPVGVPLNPSSRKRTRKPRPKSQAERVRDAQIQGKFYSPTAEVLLHGTALSSNPLHSSSIAGNSVDNGYYGQPQPSRLSVLHSGRNSLMQQTSMSSTDLYSLPHLDPHYDQGVHMGNELHDPLPSGPPSGPASGPASGLEGSSNTSIYSQGMNYNPGGSGYAPGSRTRKMRPPSTYLDDLVG